MLSVPGYEVSLCLLENERVSLWRGHRLSDNLAVVFKGVGLEASRRETAMLRRESELMSAFYCDGMMRLIEMVNVAERPVLIFEDPGGQPLSLSLDTSTSMGIGPAIELTHDLFASLASIHQQKIIHKYIQPSNIWLVDQKRALFHGFGQASTLSVNRERGQFVDDMLPHMSPEQTGRLAQSVDHRSDIYSLGTVIYRLFAGQHAFDAQDAMGWIHCHIAKQPTSLLAHNRQLPSVLVDVIEHTMVKSAKDRYQSANSVLFDLGQLKTSLKLNDGVQFIVGTQDVSNRFEIPQRLFGRKKELSTLFGLFEQVSEGSAIWLRVDGVSGIGKSALIEQIQTPIIEQRGFFLRGKFEQYQRNVPYASIIQALREMLKQLLMESDEVIQQWKTTILDALGKNTGVVVAVMPELALITGKVPTPQMLGVAESQNRFVLTFQKFMRLFCKAAHPVVLFLDDIQWADSASMMLIKAFLTDPEAEYFMLITAHRPREITELVGWHDLLAAVTTSDFVACHDIVLAHMKQDVIAEVVAQTLQRKNINDVEQVAHFLKRKTDGNPFFVRAMLNDWYDKGHIYFDSEHNQWCWLEDAIAQTQLMDNVVDLLLDRIQRLKDEVQDTLKVAACIGGQFDLETLSRVCQKKPSDIATILLSAIQDGLIEPQNDNYQYVSDQGPKNEDEAINVIYRFTHDSVQQAAYSMLDKVRSQKHHLAIGRRLLDTSTTFDRHERLFDVVSQLNHGMSQMEESSERLGLAQLNLKAARRAHTSLAYEFSMQCARAGLKGLGKQTWETQPDLTFELTLLLAQSTFMSNMPEDAMRHFKTVETHCKTATQKARVYIDQVELLALRARHVEAVKLGIDALDLLGVSVAVNPSLPVLVKELAVIRISRVRYRLRTVDDMVGLPEMTNQRVELIMTLVGAMAASANFTSDNLFPVLMLKALNLTFKYGNTPMSAMAYACVALIQGSVLGDFEKGEQLAQVADVLSKRYSSDNPIIYMRTLFLLGGLIRPWTEHVCESDAVLTECIAQGQQCGELAYTGYALTLVADHHLFMATPLDSFIVQMMRDRDILDRIRDEDSSDMHQCSLHLGLGFQNELAQWIDLFDPSQPARPEWVEDLATRDNRNPYAIYQVYCTIISVHLGRYEDAYARLIDYVLPEGAVGLLLGVEYTMYFGIAMARSYDNAPNHKRTQLLHKLYKLRKQLEKWTSAGPENCACRLSLLNAEIARIELKDLDAQNYYDAAIIEADEQGFSNIAALAAQLAGRTYFSKSRGIVARAYIERSLAYYLKWQAWGMAAHLCKQFEFLDIAKLPQLQTPVENVPESMDPEVGALDLAAVIKATQALSVEMTVDGLLTRIIELVIENAGAQRGVVFLYENDSLCQRAEGSSERGVTVMASPLPLESVDQLPRKIINYVERTQESIVLNDASVEGLFVQDDYVQNNASKSIIVLPLTHQGHLVGILYLENNLTAGAFTSQRLDVLQAMTAQLSISLENARMYNEVEQARKELEDRVVERTKELASTNDDLQLEIIKRKQAQTSATKASQSKSAFLANMSHELRTPLNAIIGYSELIREELVEMEDQEFVPDLDKILISAKHLLRLINDVLDLSKIEARKMDVHLSDIDVPTLIEEVRATTAPLIQKNNNVLHINIMPLIMRGDRTKVIQVIANLLSNASKFTDQGEISLTLERVVHDDIDWVQFSVTDTGIGMSLVQQERLFKAFSQAETDTASKYGGTGLGLALSKQLCQLMGGDLYVKSALDEGSTFTMVLPVFPNEESLGQEVSVPTLQ